MSMKLAATSAAIAGLGFGVPCAVGMRHLARTVEVWTFMGFPTYGYGPFEKVGVRPSVPLLGAYLAVCSAEVAAAWLLWRRPRAGARLAFAILPLESVFWVGFALPYGPPLGLVRTAAILAARRGETATRVGGASPRRA